MVSPRGSARPGLLSSAIDVHKLACVSLNLQELPRHEGCDPGIARAVLAWQQLFYRLLPGQLFTLRTNNNLLNLNNKLSGMDSALL